MKHTPGPYRYSGGSKIVHEGGLEGGCFPLATIETEGYSISEVQGNLFLIAAAPELLEACKAILIPDANKRIEQAKQELFRLAPELKPMLLNAIKKAEEGI